VLDTVRKHRRKPLHGHDHGRERHREGVESPRPFISRATDAISRSSRSTAAPFPRRSSSRNSSPRQGGLHGGGREQGRLSRPPTPGPSSSTRSPRSPRRPVKLLRGDPEREIRRVGRGQGHQGRRPPHRSVESRPSSRRCRRETSAKTSSTGSTSSPSSCRPLRERREDIPLHVDHFNSTSSRPSSTRGAPGFPPEAMSLLDRPWQGNIRELENVIERAIVPDRRACSGVEALPENVRRRAGARRRADFPTTVLTSTTLDASSNSTFGCRSTAPAASRRGRPSSGTDLPPVPLQVPKHGSDAG